LDIAWLYFISANPATPSQESFFIN
jgi:hypothetical protein